MSGVTLMSDEAADGRGDGRDDGVVTAAASKTT